MNGEFSIPVPEWISEEYQTLYRGIYKGVENVIENSKPKQPSVEVAVYTPHDLSHCKHVERKAYELLKHSDNKDINDKQKNLEAFLLSSSALIHDIGMHINIGKKEIRKNHHLTSAEYLNEKSKDFGFDESNLPISLKNGSSIESITHTIGLIAYYHRREPKIFECPEERYLSGICVRTRLLAAILRLADALHVDKSRVTEEKYWLLLLSNEFTLEDQFHWIKSFAVSEIFVDYENAVITVQIEIPLDWIKDPTEVNDKKEKKKKWEERGIHLENRIRRELKSEIESVKEVLRKYKIPVFHDIIFKTNPIPGYNSDLDDNFLKVLGLIHLIESGTAGQAIDIATDLILGYLGPLQGEDGKPAEIVNPDEKIDHIREFVTETLGTTFSEKRHCHVALCNLKDFVELIIKNHIDRYGQGKKLKNIHKDKLKEALIHLGEELNEQFGREKRGVKKKLTERAKEIISKLSLDQKKENTLNFLLFAKSRNVQIVISEIIENIKQSSKNVHLYVCENSSKLIYGPYGDIEYSDGIAYIEEILKDKRIDKGDVSILPDIAIATLLKNGNFPIHAILFGVNGLDIDNLTCAHTAGHLQIVELANSCKPPIPTIAIVDSIRIGKLVKHNQEEESFFRKECWLNSKGAIHQRFKGIHQWNPREDIFSVQEVTLLVSEKGDLKTKTGNLKSKVKEWAKVYNEIQRLKQPSAVCARCKPSSDSSVKPP